MESKLLVEDKSVVVPGQILAQGIEYLPSFGTYRLKENILAQQLGLLIVDGKVLKTIPLSGVYLPKVNDVVIGKVIDILMSGWRLEMNSPYSAVLPLKDASFDYIRKGEDLTNYFGLQDYVLMKLTQVTSQNLVDATVRGPGLRKLEGGRVIKVNALKVPRIIGKRGSMVNLIKSATDCDIVVGQNGLIWLKGTAKQEALAYKTISMIEEQAHVPGLTERMKEYLEKETGRTIEIKEDEEVQERSNFSQRDSNNHSNSNNYNERSHDRPRDNKTYGPSRDGSRDNNHQRNNFRENKGPRRDFRKGEQ